ncbi:MAG: Flp pilus assembly complex ATPase component TadA [Fimbriimonadaceae bacterium]|nr:Flp pilus assembly complex ATPase component TadA [Fimbriimonadaceae bacterium]NUM39625.1 Flp pilus assembly complex ATPase component TadA [Armatimonadota bacterium]
MAVSQFQSPDRLGQILLDQRLISKAQLEEALEDQKTNPSPLGTILVTRGMITNDLLLRALAAQMGVTPWHLEADLPDSEVVDLIPLEVCEKYQVLPVRKQGDLLTLAMRNPLDFPAIDLVRKTTGLRIEPVLANAERLSKAVEDGTITKTRTRSMDTLISLAIQEFGSDSRGRESNKLGEEDTRPVVEIVNQIVGDAIQAGASDVHIEPRESCIEIRYRQDGELRTAREMPLALMPLIATRLKIIAGLDIVETRLPQDGRFDVEIDRRKVDLRVAVIPNHFGQRFVLRILDRRASVKKLTELGFNDENLGLFRAMVDKPYGMVLVTGPTGSGKTTTLYAALQELRKRTSNIMTAEDPVEYEIEGISQSQVNEKIELSFPELLQAILRQDPDVILVGEIRDAETAQTAVRAALTGHLVLSTLHCNDATGAVPRMLDLGVDPFLLSTSLIGVTAQRLVRTLCPHCSEFVEDSEESDFIASVTGESNRKGSWHEVGCSRCRHTGFKGRMAVHELLAVTPDVASAIARQDAIETLRELAGRHGFRSLQEDALQRVLEGKTTLEEVKRQVFLTAGSKLAPALKLAA